MRGQFSGVATRTNRMTIRATYVHCRAHVLNLVLVDVAETGQSIQNMLGSMQELYDFFRASGKKVRFREGQECRNYQLYHEVTFRHQAGTISPDNPDGCWFLTGVSGSTHWPTPSSSVHLFGCCTVIWIYSKKTLSQVANVQPTGFLCCWPVGR